MKYNKRPEMTVDIFVGGPIVYDDVKDLFEKYYNAIKKDLSKKSIDYDFNTIPIRTDNNHQNVAPETQNKYNKLSVSSDILFIFFDSDSIGSQVDPRVQIPIDVKHNIAYFENKSHLLLSNSILEILFSATKHPHKPINIFFNRQYVEQDNSDIKKLYNYFNQHQQIGRINTIEYKKIWDNKTKEVIQKEIVELVSEQEQVFDDLINLTSPTVFPKKDGTSIYEKMTSLLSESNRLLSFHFKKNLSSSRLFEKINAQQSKNLSPRDKFSSILKKRLLENKQATKQLKFSRIAAITTLPKLFMALKEIDLLREYDTINLIYFPYKKLRGKSRGNQDNEDYFEQANIVLFGENTRNYSFQHAVWGLFENENTHLQNDDGRFSKAILYNNKLNDCPFSSYVIMLREKLEKVSPLFVSFMEISLDEEDLYHEEIRGFHSVNFYVLLNLLIKLDYPENDIKNETIIGEYEQKGEFVEFTLKDIKKEICDLCKYFSTEKKNFPIYKEESDMSPVFKDIYSKLLSNNAEITCFTSKCPLKNKNNEQQ